MCELSSLMFGFGLRLFSVGDVQHHAKKMIGRSRLALRHRFAEHPTLAAIGACHLIFDLARFSRPDGRAHALGSLGSFVRREMLQEALAGESLLAWQTKHLPAML